MDGLNPPLPPRTGREKRGRRKRYNFPGVFHHEVVSRVFYQHTWLRTAYGLDEKI
jgi:hypothetical protein